MLPADDIQALERLIDEIERVSATGIDAVRLGRKQEIREGSRRSASGNRGHNSPFRRIPMPHRHPAAKPPFESREIGPGRKRCAFSACRFAVAIRGYTACTMKQRQVPVLFRQERQ